MSRDERNRRAKDIAYSEEDEISTQDKVFLLVASSLNDKDSLPGYVYRELIREAKERADKRKEEHSSGEKSSSSRDDEGDDRKEQREQEWHRRVSREDELVRERVLAHDE